MSPGPGPDPERPWRRLIRGYFKRAPQFEQ